MEAGRSKAGRSDAIEPSYWRALAALLALALHVPVALLLLRGVGDERSRTSSRPDQERIRLTWSDPIPPPPLASRPPAAAQAVSPAATTRQREREPAAPAASTPSAPLIVGNDAWAPAARATPGKDGGGASFSRDVFERGGDDLFAPVQHMPQVRMRDRSLGGRLQEQSRQRACASLKAALQDRPESTHAILASMRRWDCTI